MLDGWGRVLLADGCCLGRDVPCKAVNKTNWDELWSLSVSWFMMLWSDCSWVAGAGYKGPCCSC